MCLSCQYVAREKRECEYCVHVPDQEIDLLSMTRYTPLPYLWDAFQTIIAVSPTNEGGFSLSGAQCYLEGCEPIEVTHSEFWNVMIYFLKRTNEKFRAQLKARTRNG